MLRSEERVDDQPPSSKAKAGLRQAGNDGHSPLKLHVGLRLSRVPKPAPSTVVFHASPQRERSSADGRVAQRSGMTLAVTGIVECLVVLDPGALEEALLVRVDHGLLPAFTCEGTVDSTSSQTVTRDTR